MAKGSDQYTIHVAPAAAAIILTPGDPTNPTALPDESEGVAMTDFDIVASGGTGPYKFSVDGLLPAGVSAVSDNVDTLRITGTPATGSAGDYAFTVSAVDSVGAAAATTRFAHSIR